MSSTESSSDGVLGTGPSAPRYFQSALFDYQLAKFLGLTTYSGAEPGECFTTASRIKDRDFESWTKEWLALAERVEKIGHQSLKEGHKISAREAFLRAATYYQAAFYFLLDKDPRKRQYHKKHIEAFASAGKLFNPPFEHVGIPYEGKTLPCWFLHSGEKRDTVIMQMGADGTAVQTYFSGGGAAALRRGYNVLLFEGPGQTSAFYQDPTLTYRYDWEVPIGCAVDWLEKREEVARISLVSYSLGGYFGPRAVAFEKRIVAAVISSLVPDGGRLLIEAYGIKPLLGSEKKNVKLSSEQEYGIKEHMPKHGFSNGLQDVETWVQAMEKWKLWDLTDKITCPLLNLTGTGEGQGHVEISREFFDKLPNKKNKYVLTTAEMGAEMHCQKGNASLLHQIEFDWLDDVLKEL